MQKIKDLFPKVSESSKGTSNKNGILETVESLNDFFPSIGRRLLTWILPSIFLKPNKFVF